MQWRENINRPQNDYSSKHHGRFQWANVRFAKSQLLLVKSKLHRYAFEKCNLQNIREANWWANTINCKKNSIHISVSLKVRQHPLIVDTRSGTINSRYYRETKIWNLLEITPSTLWIMKMCCINISEAILNK